MRIPELWQYYHQAELGEKTQSAEAEELLLVEIEKFLVFSV